MKLKKKFFYIFFLIVISSGYSMEVLPKYEDFNYLKPISEDNLDVMPFGISIQLEAGNSF